MSTITRIAAFLNISESQAQAFCLAVQRKCCGSAPTPGAILASLQSAPADRRTPDAIAAATQAARQPQTLPRRPRTGTFQGVSPDAPPTMAPMLTHDPRKATDSLAKCPHGVPTGHKCAICDHDRTSWD